MRKLSLKREALAELSGADLVQIAGAGQAATLLNLCTGPTTDTSEYCSVRCQWTFNTCETCWC